MSNITGSSKIEILKEYFRSVDTGNFPSHLFADGFQFYFPKYGIGHGAAEFLELAVGAATAVAGITHHIDDFLFIEKGNLIVVEGTSEGRDHDGAEWHGGRTPGGRFCSIFAFNDAGQIARMHVYLDPDYLGKHEARFLWPGRQQQKW